MTREQLASRFERVMYYCYFPLFVFLPISTAGFEIFSSIIIAIFFIKRITFFVLTVKDERARRISNPVVYWSSRFFKVFKPVRTPLRAAVGLFIFANLLSVIASQYPGLSWRGFFGKTIEATILFFAFIECVNSRRRLNLLLGTFAGVVAFVSFDAVVQFLSGKDFIFGRPITTDHRVTASFKHPNDFGSYLVTALPFLLAMGMWAWPWHKKKDAARCSVRALILIAASFLLAYIALGLTYSRGAWLGFAAALVLMMFLDKKKWYIPFLVGVIFFAIFSSNIANVRNVSFVTDDIAVDSYLSTVRAKKEKKTDIEMKWQDLTIPLNKFSGTGRSGFWQEALHIFESSPLFGTGLNTYSEVAPRFKITWGMWPHNCYLQMAAETGIIGLGSFLWVLFLIFRETIKTLQKTTEEYYKALLCGSLAGLTGFLGHGFLDTNFYSVNLGNLMWIMMGLIVMVLQLVKKERLES